MDDVIERTQARELVCNAALWPRVRDFLWDFAPQVHESWLGGLEWHETLDERREANPSQVLCLMPSPYVKRFILDTLDVKPCFHLFPKDDGSRLVLLNGATLLEVAKWLGALACATELRKATDGATVRALKAALPGVYPAVFGYTAYFRGMDSILAARRGAETLSFADKVVMAGFEIMLSALADIPASLVLRLKFKLPKNLCASASPRETKGMIGIPSILKLLKLKFPEAYSLCCS